MSTELYQRIDRLEQSDKEFVNRLNVMNHKLDTALLTLTHNVNSLTDAIRNLQESQSKAIENQHSIVVLQERAAVVPQLQRDVNRLMIDGSKNELILKGMRLLASAAALSLLGIAIKTIFG